jgi:hypothetical protein
VHALSGSLHPLGKATDTPVIVYRLPDGFEIVMEITLPALPPKTGLLLLTLMVGRFAFEAKTGVATGTRNRSPEIARIARIVPELNFVTYALDCVFNIFRIRRQDEVFRYDGRFVYFSPWN